MEDSHLPYRKSAYHHFDEELDGKPFSVLLRRGDVPHSGFGPAEVPEGHFFVMGTIVMARMTVVDGALYQ